VTAAAEEITAAVRAWLDVLDATQRAAAVFPFETNERFVWAYTPGTREGLALKEMTPEQRTAASAVVSAALSERTAAEVASVIALETVLGELERESGRGGWTRRDPELYWFAVFGEPDAHEPWSWRIGGHHVAIHVTLADGQVIGSAPSFLGANPAVVPHGPQAGFRAIAGEETLARTLLAGLTPDEKNVAIVEGQAPADILTEHAARADVRSIPIGIRYGDLAPTARTDLERLIRYYVDRVRRDVAAGEWERIVAAGLDELSFTWAGPEEPGHGHYYAVRGPRFLIEYDNTQNGANHIHAVWRDLENDWGEDLLANHLSTAHADR
jgi:hypothetical protein